MTGLLWMDDATFRYRLDHDMPALHRDIVNFEMFRRFFPRRGVLYERDNDGLFDVQQVGAWDDAGEVETRNRSLPATTWRHLEWTTG